MLVLEHHSASRARLLTTRTRRTLEKARRSRPQRHVEAEVPGELVCLDCFYVGKLKGVGKVWEITACDAASSYALARVFVQTQPTSETAARFLRHALVPHYRETGWPIQRVLTGLPVLPPTPEAVGERVRASRRPADEPLGSVPPRGGIATIEVLAANVAMAGCPPEGMPLLVAAIEALLEPRFNLNGVQCTTHGCWPLLIVSGPLAERLGLATAESVFSGGGSRLSVGLGRAVRLTLWNVGGAHPGSPVKEVFGHPGRYAFSIAECADQAWTRFHEARGLGREQSAVTVFACEAPHGVAFWGVGADFEERLASIADSMRSHGSSNTDTMGEILVALSPAETRHLHARGYSRERVQQRLFELSKRRFGEIRSRAPDAPARYDWWPDSIDQDDDDALVPIAGPDALERMGIPTVTLATRPFLHAARTAARAHVLPELPIVAIEHDYLFYDEATIRDRVAGVALPLLAGLLRGSD